MSSASTPPTSFAPGAFKPLGDNVFEGYIDTKNVIHMKWPVNAQTPEKQAESGQHLGTDAKTAKIAAEKAAYYAACYIKCTKMAVKGLGWHPFTVDTAAGANATKTPDPLHVALKGTQSVAWTGSFKCHVYQGASPDGTDVMSAKNWNPKLTTFVDNKGFCPKLSTRPASGLNNTNTVEPTPRPAPAAAPAATPGSSKPQPKTTIPKGVPQDARVCSKAGKPTYFASKDGTQFWDAKGKKLDKKPW